MRKQKKGVLADDLKEFMDRGGLSCRDVAEKFGIAHMTVWRIISGHGYSVKVLKQVASKMGVEPGRYV